MSLYTKRKGWLGYVLEFMERNSYKTLGKYNRFVVLSKEDADNWKELDNVSVINNFCSIDIIDIMDRAKLDEHRVISVGRYEFPKGFDRHY